MGYKNLAFLQRKVVGPNGDFATLAAAVAWFNASATAHTQILLDAGVHLISDTITVNNATYAVQISGMGSAVTHLQAATGLLNKPMFHVQSDFDINKVTADGSTLATYGTHANENFITYDTGAGIYSEITDIFVDTFTIGIADLVGVDAFIFNFVFDTCGVGISVNHAGTNFLDAEVGNFEDCPVGIDLVAATSGQFLLRQLVFLNPVAGIGIRQDGDNYVHGQISEVVGCTHNEVGDHTSGFDFKRRDGRDADIIFINNVGLENATPHAKINVANNATTTTVTTAGTYYKALGIHSKTSIILDSAATAGTFTITVDDQTTTDIAWNASAATIEAAIEALSNVTSATVTEIVAAKEWTIEFLTDGEGWVPQSVDISSLTGPSTVDVATSFYTVKVTLDQGKMTYQPTDARDCVVWIGGNLSVNQNNRNVTVGLQKNGAGRIISPFSVRTSVSGQPYGFALIVYLDDLVATDYIELYLTSANSGDVVTVQDLTWYLEAR